MFAQRIEWSSGGAAQQGLTVLSMSNPNLLASPADVGAPPILQPPRAPRRGGPPLRRHRARERRKTARRNAAHNAQ
eukprot:5330758-Pyramimonas_sp.AAC.1